MQALLHTYDSLDHKVCKKFQPVVLKGNTLSLSESRIKSTRNWGVVFLYWAAFLTIVCNAPSHAYKGYLILNPLDLFIITENYFFALTMTLIWWGSILITTYLSYILVSRIKGHYFNNDN